jgi:U3 small nucleolar RNA-associated protein 13
MLKQANDGLTKLWKPVKSNEPFNCGGKIQFLNNELIASLYEGNVVFVDNSGHNQNVSLIEESENREEIVCFCVNFLGTDIATASKNLLVRHWKIEDRTCVRSFKAHNMPVLSMCYDRTNTLIATGSADRTVKVWDIHLGYCTHVFRYHTAIVQYVEFHPDPNRLLLFSCSDDNSIKLYDLNDSSCKASFEEHMGSPTFLSFTSDGYIMASVGRDKVIMNYTLSLYIIY